jgi:hypothetical protein
MAGLGLSQAVANYQNSYQNTTNFNQQQAEVARALKQRAEVDAADQEFTGMITKDRENFVLGGGDPAKYKPPEDLMFKATEARGLRLAKAGLMDKFVENEARVAPMRLQARARAIQQYEQDRDPMKLFSSVNSSMFNGKDVVGYERIEGADAVQGLPARAPSLEVRFSDGTKQVVDPDAMVKQLKVSLLDPVATARQEADEARKRLQKQFETDEEIRKGKATAAEQRQTNREGKQLDHTNQLGMESIKTANQYELRAADNASRERVAGLRVDGQVEVAEVRADGARDVAKTRATSGGSGGRTSDEVQRFKARAIEARAIVDRLSKDVIAKEARLKDAYGTDREKIQAAIDDLNAELSAARKTHAAIAAELKKADTGSQSGPGGAGLSSAGAAPMEQARAEAISSQQPIDYNLGGKQGTISPNGGLADSAPKATTKPAVKLDMAKANKIKADFKAGKIKKDEATKQLRALGFN